jgi:hypothetical protein
MHKVAVVILNWNGLKLLKDYLPAVVAHSTHPEVALVVADNASTDQSVSYIKTHYPQISVIQLARNYGFAEGYNQVLKQINATYYVLLNSDVEVAPHWLDAPLKALENNPMLAAVQPKILAARRRTHFEYAGACGGFMDRLGYPFCRGRILHTIEEDRGQYDTPLEIFWATGACLIIRSALYHAVGGLDSQFFAHQEEIDLCWRLKSRGYQILCTPQSVVYHVGGATLSVESPRKTYLNFRNNLLMLYKNLPKEELTSVFRLRFVLDYLAATKFLCSGHPQNAYAVYRARRDFKRMKPAYKQIREDNLAHTVLPSPQGLYRGSLLKAYYLKGIKTFDLLRLL